MKRSFDSLSAGVQRKRQKLRSARTIATESASNAIRSGSIPIQEFLASRRFEIKALTESIQKSREAGVQRAFQSLPRYLRRRAASHDVKRVPKRLRSRALAELTDEDRKKQHKRIPFKRKRGRRGTMQKLAKLQRRSETDGETVIPPVPLIPTTDLPLVKEVSAGRFVARQRNKTWLPSHLWTCKRAKMATRWGYAIATSPNEKTYRSTHRASTSKGTIVFDTSYKGTILLKGRSIDVAQLIEKMTASRAACGLRAQRGQRAAHAQIFDNGTIISPVEVLWQVQSDPVAAAILCIHPGTFVATWKLALELRAANKLASLKIIDLRFQIGSIAIIGPMAVNAALSVLKPEPETGCSTAFRALHGLQPREIPSDIIIPMMVKDPRTIPSPRLVTEKPKEKVGAAMEWPMHSTVSELFSLETLEKLNASKPKLNAIKGVNCAAVPVIVRQTAVGLVLIAPWAYINDFWYALNHLPLVRFGGLQELAQIHYEHVLPHFPEDYPGTEAGSANERECRQEREARYLRRPPAKRISYAKAINGKPEVGDSFACDFEFLVNQDQRPTNFDVSHVSASQVDNSGKDGDTTLDVTMEDAVVNVQPIFSSTPQLPLQASSTQSAKSISSIPRQTISQDVSSGPPAQSTVSPENRKTPRLVLASQLSTLDGNLQKTAIVHVRIKMIQRGCPTTRARIYACLDVERDRGKKKSDDRKNLEAQPGPLIGFVTTGNFSLAEGRATGIGAIVVSHVLETEQQGRKGMKGMKGMKGECLVRNVGTGNFRRATWSVIQD